MKRITLIIDSREPTEIIKKLKIRKYLNSKDEFIDVGDYLLPNGYAVERKKGRDLMSSVMSNRLYTQLNNLMQYEHPILAIITDNKWKDFYHTKSNFIHKQYIGTLTTLTKQYNKLKIVQFDDDDEFIEYLDSLYKKITETGSSSRPSPKTRKAKNINEEMENFICSIKGFGVPMSKKLLYKFGSIEGVVNATMEDFVEVEKLGKNKAEKLYNILHTGYKINGKGKKNGK